MDIIEQHPPMRTFQSFKQVQAFRIGATARHSDGSGVLYASFGWPTGSGDRMGVSAEYMQKHDPKVGGYYVRYADGYESYSPATAFEDGYRPVDAEPTGPVAAADASDPAPRVTLTEIEANIASEHYFTADAGVDGMIARDLARGDFSSFEQAPPDALKLLTFCVLILRNGFTVTGESACVSPENFDAEKGRQIARQNAVQKIWPLMGYALKVRLDRESGAE